LFVLENDKFWIIVATNDKLGQDGELLSTEAESLLGNLERHTINLKEDTAWVAVCYPTFRITLTFTHSDIGRLASVRLVGEHAAPELALTLHVTGDSDTSGFKLTRIDPLILKRLDSEGTERQLIASLGIALEVVFLLTAVLSSFRL
jgi:hypothetical protein